jgi:hypothetical protein
MKKIMIGAVHHGIRENCLSQDDTKLVLPSTTLSSMAFFEKTLNLRDKDETDEWLSSDTDIFLNSLQNNVSEYKVNVLNHIAGYIQKKLNANEQCVLCNLFLSNLKIVRGDKLLSRKNRGGLTLPSLEFEKIVGICESVFSNILQEQGGNPFKVKNLVHVVSVRVSSVVHELHPTLLKELDEHVETMGSHRNLMLKKIVGCYTSLRVKHFCKELNMKSVKVRVQLSKLVLFKHQ